MIGERAFFRASKAKLHFEEIVDGEKITNTFELQG